jgi:hypothetical protein
MLAKPTAADIKREFDRARAATKVQQGPATPGEQEGQQTEYHEAAEELAATADKKADARKVPARERHGGSGTTPGSSVLARKAGPEDRQRFLELSGPEAPQEAAASLSEAA